MIACWLCDEVIGKAAAKIVVASVFELGNLYTAQKSFARRREYGGWILDNGDIDLWPSGMTTSSNPTLRPDNAIGSFHTHPVKGAKWIEAPGPSDMKINSNIVKDSRTRASFGKIGLHRMYTEPTYKGDLYVVGAK